MSIQETTKLMALASVVENITRILFAI